MDYFDSFDCQMQCEDYESGYYANYYSDDCYCTHGNYFENSYDAPSEQSDEFEALFDED